MKILPVLFLCFAFVVIAADVRAEPQAPKILYEQRAMGNPKAPPLVLEEFAALTCAFCAEFQKTIFPVLKKEYIDTGKMYFIFTDYPYDDASLDGAAAARCMPKDKFFPFVERMLEWQDGWAYMGDRTEEILKIAKLFGGEDAHIRPCIKNDELREEILTRMQEAGSRFKIEETPSFVLNGQVRINGDATIEDFRRILDANLKTLPKSVAP